MPRTKCASSSPAGTVLHLEPEVVAVVREGGDLLSVPSGTRHWFDMGVRPISWRSDSLTKKTAGSATSPATRSPNVSQRSVSYSRDRGNRRRHRGHHQRHQFGAQGTL